MVSPVLCSRLWPGAVGHACSHGLCQQLELTASGAVRDTSGVYRHNPG